MFFHSALHQSSRLIRGEEEEVVSVAGEAVVMTDRLAAVPFFGSSTAEVADLREGE